jgi:hypothetical protein
MVTGRIRTYGLGAYGVAVVIFFCYFGFFRSGEIPRWIEMISLPGALIAGLVAVGMHSNLFTPASIIVNVAIYFGLPCLLLTRLD